MVRKDYKMVNFDMYPPQHQALKLLSAKLNCSMATIVRYCIDEFLDKNVDGYTRKHTTIEQYKEANRTPGD